MAYQKDSRKECPVTLYTSYINTPGVITVSRQKMFQMLFRETTDNISMGCAIFLFLSQSLRRKTGLKSCCNIRLYHRDIAITEHGYTDHLFIGWWYSSDSPLSDHEKCSFGNNYNQSSEEMFVFFKMMKLSQLCTSNFVKWLWCTENTTVGAFGALKKIWQII